MQLTGLITASQQGWVRQRNWNVQDRIPVGQGR